MQLIFIHHESEQNKPDGVGDVAILRDPQELVWPGD